MSRGVLAALLAAAALPVGASAATDLREDPCFRDRELRTGPARALYATVAPFEHFGSDRSQVFPYTCSLAELGGRGIVPIGIRRSPGVFQTPYIAATRERGELFVYGYGADAARDGGFVAKVDPVTLVEVWRTPIPDRSPRGQWSYPGVLLTHGDGTLLAVYGNVLVKLDPVSGAVLARRELPEDPAGTGAAYNGMAVLPDGTIVAKRIERGPCPTAATSEGVSPVAAAPRALRGRQRAAHADRDRRSL